MHTKINASLRSHEDGLTIIEVLVAMVIALIVIVGLTGAVLSSFDRLRENQLEQQATQISIQAIEDARALPWEQLAIDTHPKGTDTRVGTPGPYLIGAPFAIPDETILFGHDAAGSPTEHSKGALETTAQQVVGGSTFSIHTYVTEASASLRRVTVVVEWDAEDMARSTHASTLISSLSTP